MKSKKNTPDKPLPLLNLNSLDGQIILISAVRYALTRSSYVNPSTSRYIKSILPLLEENVRYNIAKSIANYYDLALDHIDQDHPYHSMDVEPWLEIYEQVMGKPYQPIKEETDA